MDLKTKLLLYTPIHTTTTTNNNNNNNNYNDDGEVKSFIVLKV